MDGSEPGELVSGAVLSGAPVDLQARTARYGDHKSNSIVSRTDIMETVYTVPPRQQPNPAIGIDIIGGWTGTYYKRVIDGRTHSWDGNPPPISCRVHI